MIGASLPLAAIFGAFVSAFEWPSVHVHTVRSSAVWIISVPQRFRTHGAPAGELALRSAVSLKERFEEIASEVEDVFRGLADLLLYNFNDV